MTAKLKSGDVLRDNDPRYGGRTVTIKSVYNSHVSYLSPTRLCRIKLDRIFTDGKPRAQGWSLVSAVAGDGW